MPATETLTDSASTPAFIVPAGALGFVLWNTSAAALRIRIGATAGPSGTNEGIPLPAGDASPKYFTHYFNAPLRYDVAVHIHQASGGDIASGVGYDIITR
jgi:hypothetical protein